MKLVRLESMRNPTQIKLYDIFRKDLRMPDDRAQNLVMTINDALTDHSEQDREGLATKAFVKEEITAVKDEIRSIEVKLTRSIYLVNLIQFLAIVASVITIIAFMTRK
jgi:hypothetical protein